MRTTAKGFLAAAVVMSFMMPGCRQRESRDRSHPAQPRDRLMLTELMGSGYQAAAPLDNRYFMPLERWEAARHEFEGTLMVPEFVMRSSNEEAGSAQPWGR